MNEDNKSRKSPAFQMYADDFLSGTSDMSAEEVGGYIRLLCHQWAKNGLPNDPERLGRMAGVIGSPSLPYILSKFQECEDGKLRNGRLESIREERQRFVEKQAISGKKGAELRWKNGKPNGLPIATLLATPMATPMANALPEHSSPSPSPTPSNTLNTPLTPQEGGEEVEALKLRIGSWFGRRESTVWSQKEIKALKAVCKLKTPRDDLDALEARYRSSNRYLRKDIGTLLNNWNTEIDKSKQTQPINDHEKSNPASRFGPTDAIARRNWLMGEGQARQSAISAAESRAVDQWFLDNDVIPMQPDIIDLPAKNPAT
jgi:uncharacterized protein YdaU (DUF1376 family)